MSVLQNQKITTHDLILSFCKSMCVCGSLTSFLKINNIFSSFFCYKIKAVVDICLFFKRSLIYISEICARANCIQRAFPIPNDSPIFPLPPVIKHNNKYTNKIYDLYLDLILSSLATVWLLVWCVCVCVGLKLSGSKIYIRPCKKHHLVVVYWETVALKC